MSAPIALSCGDPAGVGLELSLKAWQALKGEVAFFLIADRGHLKAAAKNAPIVEITDPAETANAIGKGLPFLQHDFPAGNTPGQLDMANAPAVISAIKRAVDLVKTGQASALCTNPIHKKALQDGAGFVFPGHTEFLADLAGGVPVVMMLAAPGLRVVPVTVHIALADVPTALTPRLLENTLRITEQGLREKFALPAPRIAVAGLNPHAGEGGAMGSEERDVIAPVLAHLIAEGMNLTGPLPADTMFHAERRETYDAAVCMYHDQALIPLKTLDFHGGVNITLGLPFIRTSPDHGTALDIAGKGIANPASLIAALRQAFDLARRA